MLRCAFVQRKEKLLKKQHRQALMLDSMMSTDLAAGRSLRDRKPVTYTFGMCSAVLSLRDVLFCYILPQFIIYVVLESFLVPHYLSFRFPMKL